MKLFQRMFFLLLVSSLVFGQSPTNNTNSDDNRISNQIKSLQDAIASQQQQIESLRQELAARKQADATPHLANAALTTPSTTSIVQETEKPKSSPLSVRIGGMDFTPGGFVDFQNIFRTENTGNVVSTNFGAIPFSNTPAGHLTEYRATGQYSRWNLKIAGKYGANDITGYVEGDFNGNDAANVFATTNPHTLRLRLYFVDVKRGMWEFTAGQAWSLITPFTVGITPRKENIPLVIDSSYLPGFSYTRNAQLRVAKDFDNKYWIAASLESPQAVFSNITTPLPAGTSNST